MMRLTKGLVFGFVSLALLVMSVSAKAGIDYHPPQTRFGYREDANFQWSFEPYLQDTFVHAPDRNHRLVKLLQSSFDRLKGARRPVLFKNIKQWTREIWIVQSDAIDVPKIRWETFDKSVFLSDPSIPVRAALISVPSTWNTEKLSKRQKMLLDQVVFEASPELVVTTRPGQSYGINGVNFYFRDYVREWQSKLTYQHYLDHPNQINDQTVGRVYKDLELMSGGYKYLGDGVYAYSESKSPAEVRDHLQELSCETLFEF